MRNKFTYTLLAVYVLMPSFSHGQVFLKQQVDVLPSLKLNEFNVYNHTGLNPFGSLFLRQIDIQNAFQVSLDSGQFILFYQNVNLANISEEFELYKITGDSSMLKWSFPQNKKPIQISTSVEDLKSIFESNKDSSIFFRYNIDYDQTYRDFKRIEESYYDINCISMALILENGYIRKAFFSMAELEPPLSVIQMIELSDDKQLRYLTKELQPLIYKKQKKRMKKKKEPIYYPIFIAPK